MAAGSGHHGLRCQARCARCLLGLLLASFGGLAAHWTSIPSIRSWRGQQTRFGDLVRKPSVLLLSRFCRVPDPFGYRLSGLLTPHYWLDHALLDSNQRPLVLETNALPTKLSALPSWSSLDDKTIFSKKQPHIF